MILIFASALTFTQCLAAKKCPKAEDLSPACICDVYHEFTAIRCRTDKEFDLKKMFTRLSRDAEIVNTVYDLLTLDIDNKKFTEIPEDAIGNIKFQAVEVGYKSNYVKRIHSKAFQSSNELMKSFRIDVRINATDSAPYSPIDLVNSFPNLEYFRSKMILDLKVFFSAKLAKLNEITLGTVTSIEGSPFAHLKNLSKITIEYSATLRNIPAGTFLIGYPNGSRTKLEIDINTYGLNGSGFSVGVFDNPTFKGRSVKLDLSKNRLEYLEEKVFLPFLKDDERHTITSLKENVLDCDDCRSAWICKQSKDVREQMLSPPCKQFGRSLTDCERNFKHCK